MAIPATTRVEQETAFPPLFLAFELGVNTWKLGFMTGAAQRPQLWPAVWLDGRRPGRCFDAWAHAVGS
jgi:hypothetical protein